MRKGVCLICAFLAAAIFGLHAATAQFPKIPKIPKPDKSKPQPSPDPATQPSATGTPAQPAASNTPKPETPAAQADAPDPTQPYIYKDFVQPDVAKVGQYHGSFDVWAWQPMIEFRVNGPISSGSQLYAEFSPPGGPVFKFDCPTGAIDAKHYWSAECGGAEIRDDSLASTYTGPVPFAIKMRNELAGTDQTIFKGTMKVGRVHSNEVGPKAAQRFVYYVDKDWNMPIGYVYLRPDEVYGWDDPFLVTSFWVRGKDVKIEPHLFYQGKEIGLTTYDGQTTGGSCSRDTDIKHDMTLSDVDESVEYKYKWTRVRCEFVRVRGWDRTNQTYPMFGPPFLLGKNPGEYELKVLWNSHLARSLKFTVGPDGKFDNGIARANKLGSDRVIVPVQVIGDQDGQWDKNAWKTEAFWGNPLAGFTPPQ